LEPFQLEMQVFLLSCRRPSRRQYRHFIVSQNLEGPIDTGCCSHLARTGTVWNQDHVILIADSQAADQITDLFHWRKHALQSPRSFSPAIHLCCNWYKPHRAHVFFYRMQAFLNRASPAFFTNLILNPNCIHQRGLTIQAAGDKGEKH